MLRRDRLEQFPQIAVLRDGRTSADIKRIVIVSHDGLLNKVFGNGSDKPCKLTPRWPEKLIAACYIVVPDSINAIKMIERVELSSLLLYLRG